MDKATKCVVAANDYTAWRNGKPSAPRDENTFMKMCTKENRRPFWTAVEA